MSYSPISNQLRSAINPAGSTRVGDDNSYTNFTPTAASVKGALSGIDSALGSLSPLDSVFRISNVSDPSKKIAFSAAGIATSTTRTITMPNANVDLGNLTDSNISASAGIAYSKLSLSNSIVDADVSSSAAIAYSKLNLTGGIVNSDISAFAAIAYSKLAALSGSTDAVLTRSGSGAVQASAILSTNLFLADGSVAATSNLNLGGFKATNAANPTSPQDLVTKFYADNLIASLSWKEEVRLASAGSNITLSAPGASLDGVSFVSGDRFLAKDQTLPAENGIYIWNGPATPATRATDMDSWSEVVGAVMLVTEGTINIGSKWVNSNIAGGTIGTTSITFVAFSVAGTVNGTGTAGYVAYWNGTSALTAEQFLATIRGGTGIGTYATGDTLYASASNILSKLTIGSTGQVLTVSGGIPVWASPATSGTVTSVATGTGLTGGPITSTGTISLASIANNTTLANISGGSAAPTPTTLTAFIDSAIGNVQGDLLYRNATQWVVLAPGTSGQFLQTAGAAANPLWATVPSTSASGVAGAIQFSAGGGVFTSDNAKFHWDDTNFKLSIGTSIAYASLDFGPNGGVSAAIANTGCIALNHPTSATNYTVHVGIGNNNTSGALFGTGLANTSIAFQNLGGGDDSGQIEFWTNNSGVDTIPRMFIRKDGTIEMKKYGAGVAQLSATGVISSTAPGTAGNVLTSSGGVWVSQAPAAASVALSAITAATANNTIDNLTFNQVWNWSTLASGNALNLSANSASFSGHVLQLDSTGATNSAQTLRINNAGTGNGQGLNINMSGASGAGSSISANNSSVSSNVTNLDFGLNAATAAGTNARFNHGGTGGINVEMVSSGSTGSKSILRLKNSGTQTVNNGAVLLFNNQANSASADIATIEGQVTDVSSTFKGTLIFKTATAGGAPAERVRIDDIGRMGFNTASPNFLIDWGNWTPGTTPNTVNDRYAIALGFNAGSATPRVASIGIAGPNPNFSHPAYGAGTNAQAARINVNDTSICFTTKNTNGDGQIDFYTFDSSGNTRSRLSIGTDGTMTFDKYQTAGVAQFSASGVMSSTAPGTSGNVLTSSGGVWVSAAPSSSVALSAITAATASNSINNANFTQTWNWNSLGANSGLVLATSQTSATGFLLQVSSASTTDNSYGIQSIMTGTTGAKSAAWMSNASSAGGSAVYAELTNASASGHVFWAQHSGSSGAAFFGRVTGSGTRTAVLLQNDVAAANNSGTSVDFNANRTTGGQTLVAQLAGIITDISNGAYKGALIFKTANNAAPAEVARFDESGNFGINVTPTTKLHVVGTSGTTIRIVDGNQAAGKVLTSDANGVGTWTASTSLTPKKEQFTLSGTDITNQYIDLLNVAATDSIQFMVRGGGVQFQGASFDYTVNYTGGAGGKTRITFVNDLATGGPSALIAGDVVEAQYAF